VYILIKIINGIGIWIERNHCKENRFTFALQYPNEILIIKSRQAANSKSIIDTVSNFLGGNIIKIIPPYKKEMYVRLLAGSGRNHVTASSSQRQMMQY
jgi:hypothetical protein